MSFSLEIVKRSGTTCKDFLCRKSLHVILCDQEIESAQNLEKLIIGEIKST